jgi:type IV secretion system protein VirB4
MNAIEAWLGSLPGHTYANVRQPPVSTINLAHLIPLSAVWAGPERDEHFGAPPLLYGKTEGSTPFRFSLHVGDVGHTLIVGPTGAGKSVLLALMAMQFRRYERPRSSPSTSAAVSAPPRSHGRRLAGSRRACSPTRRATACSSSRWRGSTIPPSAPGRPNGSRRSSPPKASRSIRRPRSICGRRSARWPVRPLSERTLTGLAVLLAEPAAQAGARSYCLGGPWGRLLDAEAERLGEASVQAFETEGWSAPARPPRCCPICSTGSKAG